MYRLLIEKFPQTQSSSNPTVKKSVLLEDGKLKELQRILTFSSYNKDNNTRIEVVLAGNKKCFERVNRLSEYSLPVWFAKAFYESRQKTKKIAYLRRQRFIKSKTMAPVEHRQTTNDFAFDNILKSLASHIEVKYNRHEPELYLSSMASDVRCLKSCLFWQRVWPDPR